MTYSENILREHVEGIIEKYTRFKRTDLKELARKDGVLQLSVFYEQKPEISIKELKSPGKLPKNINNYGNNSVARAQSTLSAVKSEAADRIQRYTLGVEGKFSHKLNPEILLSGFERNFGSEHTCDSCVGSGSLPCRRCRETGRVTCDLCDGVGTRTCSRCYGTYTKTCTACHGSGQIPNGFNANGVPQSTSCGCGTGTVRCSHCLMGRETCSQCYGRQTKLCPSCHGSCKVTCDPCRGHGATHRILSLNVGFHEKTSLKLSGATDRSHELLRSMYSDSLVVDIGQLQCANYTPSPEGMKSYSVFHVSFSEMKFGINESISSITGFGEHRYCFDFDRIGSKALEGDLVRLRKSADRLIPQRSNISRFFESEVNAKIAEEIVFPDLNNIDLYDAKQFSIIDPVYCKNASFLIDSSLGKIQRNALLFWAVVTPIIPILLSIGWLNMTGGKHMAAAYIISIASACLIWWTFSSLATKKILNPFDKRVQEKIAVYLENKDVTKWFSWVVVITFFASHFAMFWYMKNNPNL